MGLVLDPDAKSIGTLLRSIAGT